MVFLLMGPLMVEGAYYAVSGVWSVTALVLSIPVGLLVAAILHGNEWRDIREDSRAGISTLSARIGRRWAHYGYVALVLGAYMVLALSVIAGALPAWSMLACCRCRSWPRSSDQRNWVPPVRPAPSR